MIISCGVMEIENYAPCSVINEFIIGLIMSCFFRNNFERVRKWVVGVRHDSLVV